MALADLVREDPDGRKYIVLDHFTHQHVLFLDQFININTSSGNGTTSGYISKLSFTVRPGVVGTLSGPPPHEHGIENFAILAFDGALLPSTILDPEDILIDGGPATLADIDEHPDIISIYGHDHNISASELQDIVDELKVNLTVEQPETELTLVTDIDLSDEEEEEELPTPPEPVEIPYEVLIESEIAPLPFDPECKDDLPANSINRYSAAKMNDWFRRSENEPFYDVKKSEYATTVEAEEGWIPGSENITIQHMRQGVEQLANYYSRVSPQSFQVDDANEARVRTDYYLPLRPREKAKILIRVSREWFEGLPVKPGCAEIGLPEHNVVTYTPRRLTRQLSIVSEIFYLLCNSNECVKLRGIDLCSEARRINGFLPKLRKLLKDNCFSYDEEGKDKIQIAFTEKHTIAYILFNEKPACVGFNAFSESESVESPRTVNYLSRLPEMLYDMGLRDSDSLTHGNMVTTMPMTEFVLKHTFPECLVINPSERINNSLDSVDTYLRDATDAIAEFDGTPPLPPFPDTINLDTLGNYALDTYEVFEGLYGEARQIYRTAEQFIEDGDRFLSPDFNRIGALAASAASTFAGDDIFGNLPNVIRDIGEGDAPIEKVYQHLIDKINIGVLVKLSTSLLLGTVPNFGELLTCCISEFHQNVVEILEAMMEEMDGIAAEREAEYREVTNDDGTVTRVGQPPGSWETRKTEIIVPIGSDTPRNVAGGREWWKGAPAAANIEGKDVTRGVIDAELDILCAILDSGAGETVSATQQMGLFEMLPTRLQTEISNRAPFVKSTMDNIPQFGVSYVNEIIRLAGDFILGPIITIQEFYLQFSSGDDSPYPGRLNGGVVADLFGEYATFIVKAKALEKICDPMIEDLIGMGIPSLPDIPDLPTMDPLSFIMPRIIIFLEDLVIDLIISFVLQILTPIIDFEIPAVNLCGCADSDFNIGSIAETTADAYDFYQRNKGLSPDEFLFKATGLDDYLGAAGLTELTDGIRDHIDAKMNHIIETFTCFPVGTDLDILGGNLMELLSEITTVLTPKEFQAMLSGKPSKYAVKACKDLIKGSKYVKLREAFASELKIDAEVKDFMNHVGKNIPPSKIEELAKKNQTTSKTRKEKVKTLLKEKYGDVLTPEQIGKEVDREIKRTCSSVIDIFKDKMVGDTFDAEEGGTSPTLITLQDGMPSALPAVEHMTGVVFDQMFDSIGMSFDRQIHGPFGFVQSISFKFGFRVLYDMYKESDKFTKMLPQPYERAPGEIRDSILGLIEETILNADYSSTPPAKSNPKSVEFVLPLYDGAERRDSQRNLVWKLKGLNNRPNTGFTHSIKMPAPGIAPYNRRSLIEITDKQGVDLSKYSQDGTGEIISSVEKANPAEIFSTLALKNLKDERFVFDTESIEEYLQRFGYHRTIADLIKEFTDVLLTSEMFAAGVDTISNWRLEPDSDIAGRTTTTLLNLDELKESAKQKYKEYKPQPGELPTAAMKASALGSVTEAFIRLHVVEMFLRTLPAFDVFNKDDIVDDLFLEHLKLRMREGCLRRDPYWPGYYEEILSNCMELYTDEWNRSDSGISDPYTGELLKDPKDSDFSIEDSLTYLVKKTLKDMTTSMLDLNIFSDRNRETSIYRVFLEEMMGFPDGEYVSDGVFDVPTKATTGLEGTLPNLASTDYIYEDRFRVLRENQEQRIDRAREAESDEGVFTGSTVRAGLQTFRDGGLLLEKYIQFEQAGEKRVLPYSEYMNIAESGDITNVRWGLRLVYMPEIESGASSLLREHENSFSFRQLGGMEGIDYGILSSGKSAYELESSRGTHEHFVVIQDLEPGADGRTTGYSGPMDSAHEHDVVAGDVIKKNRHDHTNVTPEEITAAQAAVGDEDFSFFRRSIDEKADHLRSYRIMERTTNVRTRALEGGLLFPEEHEYTYQWTYPLPLVEVLSERVRKQAPGEFSDYKEELMLKMMENDRFKLLFEHCFPLKKIISIMTIYTEALFSVADGGKTYNILDPVKDVFRGLFYSVGSIDSYANKNPFLAARNIGLIKGLGRRVYSGGRSRVVYSDADSAFEYDVHTDLEEG